MHTGSPLSFLLHKVVVLVLQLAQDNPVLRLMFLDEEELEELDTLLDVVGSLLVEAVDDLGNPVTRFILK